MAIPSYEDFRANVTQDDLNALTTLLAGMRISTPDPTEATGFQAMGDRLYGFEVITKLTVSKEILDGVEWKHFEARVAPQAINYVGRLAWEGAFASRTPA